MSVTVRQAIADFIDVEAGSGLAESTVKFRRRTLTGRVGFLAACQKIKGPNPTMGQVDYRCVSQFFKFHGGGNGSRNTKLIVLRKFLRWAERRKLLLPGTSADDLLSGYTHRKDVRKPKLYVPADRFGEMLDLAGKRHPRDRMVVALILFTLARQSEIKAMRLKDVDFAARTAHIFRTKTQRHTETGMTPELVDELAEYLAWYAGQFGYATAAALIDAHPDWHLTPPGCRGHMWARLNPEHPLTAAERIMHPVLAAMGYTDLRNEGCHTGRRSGARALFVHLRDTIGWDGALVRVQSMLDHDNPQMTLRYIGLDQERDELNNWLRGNSMYGTPTRAQGGQVVPFRRHTA